ncbi:MAG: zinc-binding dehydrogenase [Acidimicrobiales bacterium]
MKAAVLHALGEPLSIETIEDPIPGGGEVVLDVAAAGVASYTAGILSGARNYLLELPIVPGPGGVGRVRAVGPDTTRLEVGDWVYCDATIRARDDALVPEQMLLGWTAHSEASLPLHRTYHNGSYAEQVLVPLENVTPLGDIDQVDAGRWCGLSQVLVPFGGLLAVDLRVGETIVVNGATGGFGSAGVAVALAMGAATVVATGRNEASLALIAERLGPRVVPAPMSGDEAEDRRRIVEAAGAPIDCVLDLLPREATATQVRAAVLAVRHGGRISLMGGVGRQGGDDLALPYPWLMRNDITLRGTWMYPRSAIPRMIALIRSGHLDLSTFDLHEFALDDANAAVAHAAATVGPLRRTVIRPDRSVAR